MASSMFTLTRGSGSPLLLVHGLGSSSANWAPILDRLAARRSVIAVDLPGFGKSDPLAGPVTVATLTDAVQGFIKDEGLAGVDIVGSSMGARMVLELARRGVGGNIVALDPGGFWTARQRRVFALTIGASIKLVRRLQPALPTITGNPVGRTALLAQFSAHPWSLPAPLVLAELRSLGTAASVDEALHALVHGPDQSGAPAGSTPGDVVIGWGRQDRVTLPSQAKLATERFPDATLHWFDRCGHFPHWDQPEQTAALILANTG
ncbi:MAG: alpha/beta fold hydrolase [Geodermatophilaceae bacterium]